MTLANLRSSINLMPYKLCKKVGLGEPKSAGNCRACNGRNKNNNNFSTISTKDSCERIINQWLRFIPFWQLIYWLLQSDHASNPFMI